MALGKTAKRKRNLDEIIKPKLEKKVLTDEFYNTFKKFKLIKSSKKFKMYVYNHELLNGVELSSKQWYNWIIDLRKENGLNL